MESAGRENRIVATADGAGAVAVLYHVQDRLESFFDPTTFCSRSTSRHVEEGFRRVETSITFDYANAKSVFDQKNLKKKDSKHVEHEIPPCVTDMLSGIYYAGSLPLEPGKMFSFPLNDGGPTVIINLHVEGREELKTPAGTFKTVRVQPEAASGLVRDKGKLWIWYSEDLPRIPVQMRAHELGHPHVHPAAHRQEVEVARLNASKTLVDHPLQPRLVDQVKSKFLSRKHRQSRTFAI
jgi:hypothetical protein